MILRVNTDMAAGGFGLGFAALLWLGGTDIGRLSILFPRAVLVILVAFSLLLFVKGFFRPGERSIEISGSPLRLLVLILLLLVWWFAIGKLGFVVSSFLIMLFITWFLARVEGPVSWKRLLLWTPIIAVMVGGFYSIFTQVLNVRLPSGLLF